MKYMIGKCLWSNDCLEKLIFHWVPSITVVAQFVNVVFGSRPCILYMDGFLPDPASPIWPHLRCQGVATPRAEHSSTLVATKTTNLSGMAIYWQTGRSCWSGWQQHVESGGCWNSLTSRHCPCCRDFSSYLLPSRPDLNNPKRKFLFGYLWVEGTTPKAGTTKGWTTRIRW